MTLSLTINVASTTPKKRATATKRKLRFEREIIHISAHDPEAVSRFKKKREAAPQRLAFTCTVFACNESTFCENLKTGPRAHMN
jgi:hypothetical protein